MAFSFGATVRDITRSSCPQRFVVNHVIDDPLALVMAVVPLVQCPAMQAAVVCHNHLLPVGPIVCSQVVSNGYL
jgi:hypothetical protein